LKDRKRNKIEIRKRRLFEDVILSRWLKSDNSDFKTVFNYCLIYNS
jgi:hypothetical protein